MRVGSHNTSGRSWLCLKVEPERLRRKQIADGLDCMFEQFPYSHRLQGKRHLAGIGLAQVEHIVDEAGQVFGVALDGSDVGQQVGRQPVLVGQGRTCDQAAKADNHV